MKNIPYKHSVQIHNTEAARIVLPLVRSLVNFKSVIDFGCGLGSWLAVANELGANKILGIDGEFVPRDKLYINNDQFIARDLTKPLLLQGKYDLAISLEVAEHLPFEISDDIIEFLTQSSDNVLFSAALKLQTGQNHINEQWPEFWADKFRKKGFHIYDFIRLEIWTKKEVEWWYKQNIFFASKSNYSENQICPVQNLPVLIHPENYLDKMNRLYQYQNGNIPWKTILAVVGRKIKLIKKLSN